MENVSKHTRTENTIYGLLHTDVEGFDSLAQLALDLRWTWNHSTDEVWRKLDPALWEFTHNPWVVLQTVSRENLEDVLVEPSFRKNVEDLLWTKRNAAEAQTWFQQHHPQDLPEIRNWKWSSGAIQNGELTGGRGSGARAKAAAAKREKPSQHSNLQRTKGVRNAH